MCPPQFWPLLKCDLYLFIVKIEKLEKANEKLQLGRKKIQEALVKVLAHAKFPALWGIP